MQITFAPRQKHNFSLTSLEYFHPRISTRFYDSRLPFFNDTFMTCAPNTRKNDRESPNEMWNELET